jgi:DNA-binding Lrp family transcriptional regulator
MDRRTLKQKAQAVTRAHQARDASIREAIKDGMSLREVADAVGLSHTAVANIVRRETDK